MIIKGMLCGKGGKPTKKVKNLRRFTEQWAEFEDGEHVEFGDDDVEYVGGVLHLGEGNLDRYHELANGLEV